MAQLSEYTQALTENSEFLHNHNKLLESLVLSKQNDCSPVYTDQTTEQLSDGSIQSGEGIS